MTEPTREATEPAPPEPASSPAPNGDEELSLARMSDDGAPPPEALRDPAPSSDTPMAPATDALTLLELRVRRLEDALAQLQQHGIETHVVTHLGAARSADRPPVAPVPPPAPTGILLDVGKRLLGTAANAVPPAPTPPPAPTARGRLLWLLRDTWAEARSIVRMFVDPRYRLPWSARVLSLVLVVAILTSYYWVPGTSILVLGSWINKAVDLFLAFLLFKWLGHEARRYRQTAPDLPPSLRL
jgi:hypothetical protein